LTQLVNNLLKGADIRSDGIELEATVVPVAGLTVNGSYGYTKVKSSGQLRTFQPKSTAYLGVEYEFPRFEDDKILSARLDASWHSKVHRLQCIAGQNQVPATDQCVGTADHDLDQRATIPATTLLGARVTLANIKLDSRGTTGRLSLWGRNLLNKHDPEFNFTLGGSTITNTFMQPRTYGIEFSMDY
jgi:outer membrane receptor protein involved in Fe transport